MQCGGSQLVESRHSRVFFFSMLRPKCVLQPTECIIKLHDLLFFFPSSNKMGEAATQSEQLIDRPTSRGTQISSCKRVAAETETLPGRNGSRRKWIRIPILQAVSRCGRSSGSLIDVKTLRCTFSGGLHRLQPHQLSFNRLVRSHLLKSMSRRAGRAWSASRLPALLFSEN